jgi:uncharacterized repeat protein (TIGR01451 family)
MKTHRTALILAWLALLPAVAPAQPRPVPLPVLGPAPLLYVLLTGPAGVRVTFYQGAALPREFPLPVVVGLRPGYIYRPRLTGFPSRPGLTLYPTLEVRGTLKLPPVLAASRFPAAVTFNELDIERLLSGSLLTRVVYLENPCKAFAEPARVDQPIEVELPPDRNLLDESRQYGRPVLVVRSGDRSATEAELRRQSVPNTILFPDEKALGWPPCPPQLPWACFPWFDPVLGPKPPEEECLHDGGDCGEPVGFDETGRLYGLDPEDTVAEYRRSDGRKCIAISNRCCLCVPRFAVLRSELRLEQTQLALAPIPVRLAVPPLQLEVEQAPLPLKQFEQPIAVIGTLRPSGTEVLVGTAVVGRLAGVEEVSVQLRTNDVTGICQKAPEVPEKPLALCKTCDHKAAQLGDVVTYAIRFSNQGGKPISDVVVSDSLTARLEYIPGSNRSSRAAAFTTQQNEAGSLVLRWEIAGVLLPGESGVVTFQARVR